MPDYLETLIFGVVGAEWICFQKKKKTRELRVSLPARLHLKSPGWPFRQVCESFPYSIHSLIDLTDFNVLRLRYWSYIYFQKVDEDISANETS